MPAFTQPEEQKLARIAYEVIQQFENQPQAVPTLEHLRQPEIQAAIVQAVEERRASAQGKLDGVTKQPDIAAVVAKMVDLVVRQTIAIPRILVVAERRGAIRLQTLHARTGHAEVPSSFRRTVDSALALRTHQLEVVALGRGGVEEARLEDYIVSGLVDFDDVCYDDHADLLCPLHAGTQGQQSDRGCSRARQAGSSASMVCERLASCGDPWR